MKTHRLTWLLALAAATASVHARPPKDEGNRRPPPIPPWFAMLDTDRDKVLSDAEIKAAEEIIAGFDANGDGEISLDELHGPPPPPEGDEGPKGPPPGGKPPHPPVIAALDTDQDGTISAAEMENAPESLKTLDKDGDGELSPEELRPHGPPPRKEGDEPEPAE